MSVRDLDLITPDENERDAIIKMNGVLTKSSKEVSLHSDLSLPKLVSANGDTIVIPSSVFQVLLQIVSFMMKGKAFSVVPYDKLLSTQDAADILSVSRPFVVKLLEAGHIAFVKVGTHRRIQYGDLLAYKKRRDEERFTALDEMANFSQEIGNW